MPMVGYEWDTYLGRDARPARGACGVCGSETDAVARVEEALGSMPLELAAWGRVGSVTVDLTRGCLYQRGGVPRLAVRGPDGSVTWEPPR